MSENRAEIVTGGVVLAAALGFLVYAGQITGYAPANPKGYPLTASFRSLEGVNVGTDIRLAGVKIGTVTGIELDTQTYRAETTLAIRDGIAIPDESAVVVASEGLLGGNFIEIVPGGSLFYLEPGEEIIDTQGAVSLVSLLLKFVTGSEE